MEYTVNEENKEPQLNTLTRYIEKHNNFLNDVNKRYIETTYDEQNVPEYLEKVYLETLKCLYKISKKRKLNNTEIKKLFCHACLLKNFEAHIIKSLFGKNAYDVKPGLYIKGETKRIDLLLERILNEYDKRCKHHKKKEILNDVSINKLKSRLFCDCLSYIQDKIGKQHEYIYNIISKLNCINLTNQIKGKRGYERKNKFLRHIYNLIDKTCVNLLHMAIKKTMPMVFDVSTVLNHIFSITDMSSSSSVNFLKHTIDPTKTTFVNIKEHSLLYAWFLVMFGIFKVKNSKKAESERENLKEQYLNMEDIKANEYVDKKFTEKFLESRKERICENMKNYQLKFEWGKMKKSKDLKAIFGSKLNLDTEEFRTQFETVFIAVANKMNSVRQTARCLYKLVGGTFDAKELEILIKEKDHEDEDDEKGAKRKGAIEETNPYVAAKNEIEAFCRGLDDAGVRMMSLNNRTLYMNRDAKVMRKRYFKELVKRERLPFKANAKKKLIVAFKNDKGLPQNVRKKIGKQLNYLLMMSKINRKFKETFERFSDPSDGFELSSYPPTIEDIYKKWLIRYKKMNKIRINFGHKHIPAADIPLSFLKKAPRINLEEKEESEDLYETNKEDTKEEKKRKKRQHWIGRCYKKVEEEFKKSHPVIESHPSDKIDVVQILKDIIKYAEQTRNRTTNIKVEKDEPEKIKEPDLKTRTRRRNEANIFCDVHSYKLGKKKCELDKTQDILIPRYRRLRLRKMINDLTRLKERETAADSKNDEPQNVEDYTKVMNEWKIVFDYNDIGEQHEEADEIMKCY